MNFSIFVSTASENLVLDMKRHARERRMGRVSATDDDGNPMFVRLLGAVVVLSVFILVAGTSGRDGKGGCSRLLLTSWGGSVWRMTHDDVGYLMLGLFCVNDISSLTLFVVLCVAVYAVLMS